MADAGEHDSEGAYEQKQRSICPKLNSSFPQLRFGDFRIGENDRVHDPNMSRATRLSEQLSRSKSMEESHQYVLEEMQRFYKTTKGGDESSSQEYESSRVCTLEAYKLLAEYLATGSCSHLVSTEKCLLMLSLVKNYGMCKDKVCGLILNKLKEQMDAAKAVEIIAAVGFVTETGEFDCGEPYFMDYAVENAWSVDISSVVKTNPELACLLLQKLAAKTKPPEPRRTDGEDDADEED